MKVTYDAYNERFNIDGFTKEEIINLMDSFDYCPLPLKRGFYRLKEDISKKVISVSEAYKT